MRGDLGLPPISDYEKERDHILDLYMLYAMGRQSGTTSQREFGRRTAETKQAIDSLVHQEVQKALDELQHRMLKKNEDIDFQARLDELECMKFIDKEGNEIFTPYVAYRFSKHGLLLNWDDRVEALRAQLKNKEGTA